MSEPRTTPLDTPATGTVGSGGSEQGDRFEHTPTDFVSIIPPSLVYIGVASRAEFDALAVPVHDHGENAKGHLLTKSIEGDGVLVVFQYWIKSLTIQAIQSDMEKRRAAIVKDDPENQEATERDM